MAETVKTFAWPIGWTPDGRFASARVDSSAEIGQAVDAITQVPAGSIRAMPDFGRPELAFGQGERGVQERAAALDAAIRSGEPRATGYELYADEAGNVTVDVRGVADTTTDVEIEL